MEQSDLQRYVVGVLEQLNIPYFITGSVATIFFGEPRLTIDIDIVADVRTDHISQLLAAFPPEEFYLSSDAILHALKHQSQFNILHPTSGLKVDIFIPRLTEQDRSRFARRVRVKPGDYEAYFSSPEDIIISKMQAYEEGGSDKHLRDIAGILKIMGQELDRSYIQQWVTRLGLDDIWKQFTTIT